ncbi:GSCOCG00005090001-RA-CDS [Cotesia congregata]|uniref:Similar to HSCB: Iron-sulfur cluster co-chaperone protein HscB (Homo sapiens) n=1 Tax=Cotesia congregata TaxID=51543 RepID=A0A8J2MX74_COTCN|nr:GSCOCG00005090001-RA-CDS [Cotesia congregata]CAG5101260.1 Similar to HSCB: Iron-sulfur cluster co-chaperone protein HscB (Homo sapiens) [Cotesia congregata]
MGSRLVYSLVRPANFARVWSTTNCQRIHAVWAKKDIDLEYRFSPVSLYSSDVPKKCWQCNFPFKSEIFCKKCETVLKPPEEFDYFEILGIERKFDLDMTDVRQKYKQLQNKLHPDKLLNKPKKDQQYLKDMSGLISNAYYTLLNPLHRGIYLLELNNLSVPEETVPIEPEFIMEIMERNEVIDDAGTDKDKIIKIMKENREILAILTNQLSEAFKTNDIEKARYFLVKMKYFTSIDDRLKELKDKLGIVT